MGDRKNTLCLFFYFFIFWNRVLKSMPLAYYILIIKYIIHSENNSLVKDNF